MTKRKFPDRISPAGRKKSPDRVLAENIGLSGYKSKRLIARIGGADRLSSMSEESRSYMLSLVRKDK